MLFQSCVWIGPVTLPHATNKMEKVVLRALVLMTGLLESGGSLVGLQNEPRKDGGCLDTHIVGRRGVPPLTTAHTMFLM